MRSIGTTSTLGIHSHINSNSNTLQGPFINNIRHSFDNKNMGKINNLKKKKNEKNNLYLSKSVKTLPIKLLKKPRPPTPIVRYKLSKNDIFINPSSVYNSYNHKLYIYKSPKLKNKKKKNNNIIRNGEKNYLTCSTPDYNNNENNYNYNYIHGNDGKNDDGDDADTLSDLDLNEQDSDYKTMIEHQTSISNNDSHKSYTSTNTKDSKSSNKSNVGENKYKSLYKVKFFPVLFFPKFFGYIFLNTKQEIKKNKILLIC